MGGLRSLTLESLKVHVGIRSTWSRTLRDVEFYFRKLGILQESVEGYWGARTLNLGKLDRGESEILVWNIFAPWLGRARKLNLKPGEREMLDHRFFFR